MQSRIKVRVVCARAYHALFMHNMMIRPTEQELASFGKPDFTIFNAGAFPVNRYTSYMSSSTSVDVNLRCRIVNFCQSLARMALNFAASLNLLHNELHHRWVRGNFVARGSHERSPIAIPFADAHFPGFGSL